jgi:hypothetical protein
MPTDYTKKKEDLTVHGCEGSKKQISKSSFYE